MKTMLYSAVALTLALPCILMAGPVVDASPDRVWSPLNVPFKRLGSITPRPASQIKASNWTIGCECLDRDFDRFEGYRDYLEPLGIKTIRLQAGWAKTEKQPGVLDFKWLDDIVDYAVGHGLNVLLETDYGNDIYEGGGNRLFGSEYPTGAVAQVAWDHWVDELSKRYKGKVRDWAMWNEPDLLVVQDPTKPNGRRYTNRPAEAIVEQNIRTARIIRRNIPDARIGALSLASSRPGFVEKCLKLLAPEQDLFTWIIYHGYSTNPDHSYKDVRQLKELVKRYMPKCELRQGENGCPSGWDGTDNALNFWPWTEFSQAKWDMRRMLGDLGHDVPSAVFTMLGGGEGKGLTRRDKDCNVVDLKVAYYAVQNVASFFDCSLRRVTRPTACAAAIACDNPTIAFYEYAKNVGGQDRRVYVFWDHGDLSKFHAKTNPQCPSDSFDLKYIPLVVWHPIPDPVWIDLLTGKVYEFPKRNVIPTGRKTEAYYKLVPVYDSPCILTDRSVVFGAGK